jgi:hypothetical protein
LIIIDKFELYHRNQRLKNFPAPFHVDLNCVMYTDFSYIAPT